MARAKECVELFTSLKPNDIKVNNNSDVEQLSYLRIFDSEGARK